MNRPKGNLCAEMFFEPRAVRSGSIGTSPKRQKEINSAIAIKRAECSSKNIQKLAIRTKNPSTSLDIADAALRRRDILYAQRAFIRHTAGWWCDIDADMQENLLRLIEHRHDGSITQAEFSLAVRSARRSITGSTPTQHNYWQAYRSNGLSSGW